MNITERILNDPTRPAHSDVREQSKDSNYPYGVIIHLIGGVIFYRGFHAGNGMKTGAMYTNRDDAVRELRKAVL